MKSDKKLKILIFLMLLVISNCFFFTTNKLNNNIFDKSSDLKPSAIIFPKIDRYPKIGNLSHLQNMLGPEFPSFDTNSNFFLQVDVRSCDLTQYNLINREYDCMHANFDSKTIWPDLIPPNFDPNLIMELGKDPGLNINTLHSQGITGKGIGIAIIDEELLVNHSEYFERVQLYEEINFNTEFASVHGAAVTSIAVGKNIGVAPEANLYYIACNWTDGFDWNLGSYLFNYTYTAQAIKRILEVNEQLQEDNKIRVLSISKGWEPGDVGFEEVEAAVQEAMNQGIWVVTARYYRHHLYNLYGLSREPLEDPNLLSSYNLPWFWRDLPIDDILPVENIPNHLLLVPMCSITTASPTGINDYVYWRDGGYSWAIPYFAALYALAYQVNPNITPDLFEQLALNTAIPLEIEQNNIIYYVGKILNPVQIIETLQDALTQSDTIAPTVIINNPTSNVIYDINKIYIEYSISEPATCTYYIDDVLYPNFLDNCSYLEFSDGSHNITIIATDLAGNIGHAEVSFFIGGVTIEIISPEGDISSPSERIRFEYTISDPVDVLDIEIDDFKNNTAIPSGTFLELNEGTHIIKIKAFKYGRLVGLTELNFTLDIYLSVYIFFPENGGNYIRGYKSFTYRVSQPAMTAIYIDGRENDTAIPSGSLLYFEEGTHTIEIVATDNHGNTASYSASFNLYHRGDVNMDGNVDIVDALLTAQYYVGLDPQNFIFPEAADVNRDGVIDIVDALLTAQYYVGVINEFP
ncbi:MAG: hypothetical protein KGD63_08245 [Candidatus Lokiarchaeota archaeon]|nr:hypothetical protein [Candidatus Lokiarchaeota archaeon]